MFLKRGLWLKPWLILAWEHRHSSPLKLFSGLSCHTSSQAEMVLSSRNSAEKERSILCSLEIPFRSKSGGQRCAVKLQAFCNCWYGVISFTLNPGVKWVCMYYTSNMSTGHVQTVCVDYRRTQGCIFKTLTKSFISKCLTFFLCQDRWNPLRNFFFSAPLFLSRGVARKAEKQLKRTSAVVFSSQDEGCTHCSSSHKPLLEDAGGREALLSLSSACGWKVKQGLQSSHLIDNCPRAGNQCAGSRVLEGGIQSLTTSHNAFQIDRYLL